MLFLSSLMVGARRVGERSPQPAGSGLPARSAVRSATPDSQSGGRDAVGRDSCGRTAASPTATSRTNP